MSFSSETKNELALLMPEKRCCMLAQIAGFVRTCGSIKLSGRGMSIKLVTENAAAARTFIKLLKRYYQIEGEMELARGKTMKKENLYELTISPEMNAQQILREIGILRVQQGLDYLNQQIPEEIIKNKCCKKAMLRGLFLGSGSISDPEKGYHLEIVTASEELAENIRKLLHTFEINAKVAGRKKNTIVYVKESEHIVDFFNIIGAHGKLLAIENIRIMKDMRNRTNRVVNCETANLDKVVSASGKQVEAINRIIQVKGLAILPEKLREAAVLRLENPEASLLELVEIMDYTVSKSGLNHRLKKIEEIAARL